MLHQTTMSRPKHPIVPHEDLWLRAIEGLQHRDFWLACGLLLILIALL